MSYLSQTDPTVAKIIKNEDKRQAQTLMMIPSENYASQAVQEAMSSSLGNKYAEGYPARRYYQGNEFADQIEQLCIDRAQTLFGVPFVNVQPHSGSPANFAAFNAILSPGDTFLGLSLASGGHLTHGAKYTASSRFFNAVQYEVGKDGYLDYDEIARLAKKHKPKVILAGTTAYPRLLDWERFATIAKSVDAYLMCDIAHIAGLIAAGVYPTPVPYAHLITTTTHKSLRGPRGAMIMVTHKGLKKDPDLGKKVNSAIIPGTQGGPHLNSIAALCVALKEASTPKFKEYARQIIKNATTLAAELENHGFGIITHGTDSHLIVADVTPFGLLGNTMAEACEAANIILNRNSIPHDPNPPFYPSGVRLGTPGVTTRLMKEREMKIIARAIAGTAYALQESLQNEKVTIEDQRNPEIRARIIAKTPKIKSIKKEILTLCKDFPIPKKYV
jgi:glycine hydroxymethyltransferase